MSVEDKVLDYPAAKSEGKNIPLPGRVKVPAHKSAMVLDMGEASREEGFRLNGCR